MGADESPQHDAWRTPTISQNDGRHLPVEAATRCHVYGSGASQDRSTFRLASPSTSLCSDIGKLKRECRFSTLYSITTAIKMRAARLIAGNTGIIPGTSTLQVSIGYLKWLCCPSPYIALGKVGVVDVATARCEGWRMQLDEICDVPAGGAWAVEQIARALPCPRCPRRAFVIQMKCSDGFRLLSVFYPFQRTSTSKVIS